MTARDRGHERPRLTMAAVMDAIMAAVMVVHGQVLSSTMADSMIVVLSLGS